MANRQLRHSRTPARDILILLLNLGFGAVLILTVIAWPPQSLLIYAGLIILAAVVAGTEAWTHHRADRAHNLRVVITLPRNAHPDRKDGDS